ncbi:MAG: CPBP family intramembrane glutamic endopeptidase [Myxococcota bacterium]
MVARAEQTGGRRLAAAPPSRRPQKNTARPWYRAYLHSSSRPEGAALAVLPLLLVYGVGLLFASPEARSGVDVISHALLDLFGLRTYVGVLAIAALLVLLVASLRLGGRLGSHALLVAPVAAEATLYGLVMGTLILDLMEWRGLLGPLLVDATWLEHVVMSAGAGLCEETLFRLLLIPGLTLLLHRGLAMPRVMALATAVVATSVAFAAAHLLGGEPWDAFAFTYRTIAGGAFATLFLVRGFAVAAWSHAAYDLYVLSGMSG